MRAGTHALVFALAAFHASAVFAVPLDYAFTAVPSRFEDLQLTAGSRALGEVCYSREVMPDGTICNPAYLPYNDESFILGRVFIGNGYQNLNTAQQLLFDNISSDFLQSLFTQNSVTSFEANLGLYFTTKYFSADFSPYRIQYVSEVHNPNFPVVEIHAALERQFEVSGGVPLSTISPSLQGLTFGTRFRLLQRRFVHSAFSAADLANTDPSQLAPIQSQLAFFMEPDLAWQSFLGRWKFLYSVGAVNIGPVQNPSALYPEPIEAVMGIGIEPPLPVGTLRLSLDLVNLFHGSDWSDRIRFGVGYHYGLFELMAGANETAYTIGLQYGVSFLMAGIVYEFPMDNYQGSPAENNLATEFAVKF